MANPYCVHTATEPIRTKKNNSHKQPKTEIKISRNLNFLFPTAATSLRSALSSTRTRLEVLEHIPLPS